MSPSATSARASPAAAALTKKARAVAMSPLAKATSPSAHSRRASSIGIASVAPRLPTACWVDGLFAQRGRELADGGLVDRLSRQRRRRPLDDGGKGLTKIGSSTAALTCMADGSSRGQAASTSMPAMTAARTLDRAFQEIASVRLPIASGRASASGLHKVDPNPRRLANWPSAAADLAEALNVSSDPSADGFFASSQL